MNVIRKMVSVMMNLINEVRINSFVNYVRVV